MPNLRGASPVGRDVGGSSYSAQTDGGEDARGVAAAAGMTVGKQVKRDRRRGRCSGGRRG